MKKLVYIISVLVLFGCCPKTGNKRQAGRKHVYSTYYGDFDIDTLKVSLWTEENYPCYRIKVIEKDSIIIGDVVKYLPCPQEILYCPKKDCYYKLEPALHETAVYEFDPTFDYHKN